MRRLVVWGVMVVILIAGVAGWIVYQRASSVLVSLTPENLKPLQDEVAAQNEEAFYQPTPQPARTQTFNADKNLYFGDLHVHTALSFDSYLFGNRNTIDDAYDFAKGKPLYTVTGEKLQLSRPLDFVGLSDHAETFGLMHLCSNVQDLPEDLAAFCRGFDSPSVSFFMELRKMGQKRPMVVPDFICEMGEGDCRTTNLETGRPMWELIRRKAEENNEPGVFTAFAGYEYSPPLPERGKHHRNIFFRNSETSRYAYSAFDARTAPELWRMLEEDCTGDCEFLTIPHNPNKTWGLSYALSTIDGDPYTKEDWERRNKYEPLVEIFQIKGNSECVQGFGSTDEECSYEQFLPPCEGGESVGCITQHSMVRDGLRVGLELEQDLGFNPMRVGFIGSTDTHNSSPGDTEEYDFRGPNGLVSSPASKRIAEDDVKGALGRNPGGLAAVWATENTRDALFDSMQARETYATSGTRIRLRFFGGDLSPEILNDPEIISRAYASGVPMGSELTSEGKPKFLIWAARDPMTVPLDRVQVVKGWVRDGKRYEKVVDVACSEGREADPETGLCTPLDAQVDMSTCSPAVNRGAEELKVHWTDREYDPSVKSFYYIRVLEIPTCRWSAYDALRLGRKPPQDAPSVQSERAWSSPIWVSGTDKS